jgi:hypothetical protein
MSGTLLAGLATPVYRKMEGMHVPLAHAPRPKPWQWPTVLSLDAPAVAVAWQALVARAVGVQISWAEAFVLGASVWLAYVCDRWLEGVRLDRRTVLTPRHHFHQRWRWPIAAVWLLMFAADVAVAFTHLSSHDLAAGAALAASAVAYVVSHQWLHRHSRWRVPKELCIAALLAGGVVIFIEPATRELAWLAVAPGAAFFANCALISEWEREIDAVHEQTSLARQPGTRAFITLLSPVAAAIAVGLAVAMPDARAVAMCALASAVALAVLDRVEPRIGWEAARVLADAALLTPVVALFW